MKNWHKKTILIVLVLVALSEGLVFHLTKESNATIETKKFVINYIPHTPILIERDNDFIIFPGEGTKDNPFILENFNISASFSPYGINISDTTKFFIIQNCYIDTRDVGIWISWIRNGTAIIKNNIIVNHNSNGIDLWDVSGIFVTNNIISNNYHNGIQCIDSDNVLISNNLIYHNGVNGISLRFGNKDLIQNNTCIGNQKGIEVYFDRFLKLVENKCFNNTNYGLFLWETSDSEVIQNNVSNMTGIACFFKDSAIVEVKTNYLINNSIGLYMEQSDSFHIFNNSIVNNVAEGIKLFESDYDIIDYNFILNNGGYGVSLNYSSNNIIHHNNFIDNNLVTESQGYSSDGNNNKWYDDTTKAGNYWSNRNSSSDYLIAGSVADYDIYPLKEPVAVPRTEINSSKDLLTTILVSVLLPFLLLSGIFTYFVFYRKYVNKNKISNIATLDYISKKQKIAYSDDVGVVLFRFGKEGGEIVLGDLRKLKLDSDVFIGFSYVSIGQGQRYETGVYGPLPAPSLENHNTILFAFWGKDDVEGDPRFRGKQYYLAAIIFPENKTEYLVSNKIMNEKFKNYIKKFKFPNRMTIEELNFLREIVFV